MTKIQGNKRAYTRKERKKEHLHLNTVHTHTVYTRFSVLETRVVESPYPPIPPPLSN